MGINLIAHNSYPEQILIRVFKGSVEVEDIVESWKEVKRHPLLTHKTKGIINDLSQCNLKMNMDGFKTLMTFLSTQDYLKTVKLAVITDTPSIVVFPMLGQETMKAFNIKPFCTEVAAVNWILE